MKKFAKCIAFICASMFVLFTAACGSSNSSDNGGVVKIGYSGPLSGSAALYGERTQNGITMAIDEINEAGGFEVDGKNYTLELVSLDDKYLPNETAANAKRLVQEHKPPIIFTPHSGGALALQVFNEVDKFIISAYTSEPNVTASGNKLTVLIPPKYDGYIEPFTAYTMEKYGNKIASLPTSSQYGKDWSEKLLPHWKDKGGEVVFESSIDFSKETDYFTVITNALKNKPDVIFLGGASEPVAKVVKQARELGFEGGFIFMDQSKLNEMKAITGTYEELEGGVGVLPLIYSSNDAIPAFVEKYTDKFDEEPGSEAGINYLSLYTFVEAMKAAKTVSDVEKIRSHMQKGLDNLDDAQKVYTIPTINDDGSFNYDLNFGAVVDAKVVEIEK